MSETTVSSKPQSHGRRKSSLRFLEALQSQIFGDTITNPRCNGELELETINGIHQEASNRRRSSVLLLEALKAGAEYASNENAKNISLEVGEIQLPTFNSGNPGSVLTPKQRKSLTCPWSSKGAVEWDDINSNEATPTQRIILRKRSMSAGTELDTVAVTPWGQIVAGPPSSPPPLRSSIHMELLPPRSPSPVTILLEAPKATRKRDVLFNCDRTKGSICFDSQVEDEGSQHQGGDDEEDSVLGIFPTLSTSSIFAFSESVHGDDPQTSRELNFIFRTCTLNDDGVLQPRSASSYPRANKISNPLPPSRDNYQSVLHSKLVVPIL